MVKISDLRDKEIVNATDGRRLGFFEDVDVDLETGHISAFVIPMRAKFLGVFGRENSLVISWSKIVKIGVDVILVELSPEELPPEEDDEA
ncbi:MAG: YlmC/YmxH family sporulation protein [Bacillota bacterium]